MKTSVSYPVQMASIKKNDWRLRIYIDQKLSNRELIRKENELWKKIGQIVDNSQSPPKTCTIFPDSKLLGYGWEWAVYALPNSNQVVKVPAGIFAEVNKEEYLENTEYTYQVCNRFIEPFLVKTSFERRKNKTNSINTILQRRLSGKECTRIKPEEIHPKVKTSLIALGKGLLKLLEEHDWIPDFNLHKTKFDF